MTEISENREIKIISAIPLNDEEKEAALKKAEKFLGLAQEVRYEVNQKILGGLVFKTKDKILDLSVAEKLNKIRNLLEA